MTEEERKKIDPELCAEGLHKILNKYFGLLSFKEMAIFYGAISLLYNCYFTEWATKGTERYDKWNPFDESNNT